MFQKSCTFAPSKQKDDNRSLILGYGVMVTQQILVLFFLVRVQVAQQIAQMAESVDALVSNTSGVTSIPVRPRVWVLNKRLSNELSIT